MQLRGLRELGRRLFPKHGHASVPVLLGILSLVSGLGHALFDPAIGVRDLAAAVLVALGVLLAYVRRTRAALVCYGISAGCVVITVVMQVATLIRQVSQ